MGLTRQELDALAACRRSYPMIDNGVARWFAQRAVRRARAILRRSRYLNRLEDFHDARKTRAA